MFQDQMISRMCEYGDSMLRSTSAKDPRISPSMNLTFMDGTQSTISEAYASVEGDWLYVVSLHDGYFLFHKADLLKWTPQTLASETILTHSAVARGGADTASPA